MKIGLILAYRGVNYGMLLQAYALQRVIEKYDYETEIIEYTRVGYKHIRFTPWLLRYAIDEICKRVKLKNINIELDKTHLKNIEDRKKISNVFIQNKLTNRKKCKGIIELETLGKSYDGVLIGSDQIWPPDSVFGNFTTLRFVPDETNKISYATSLGVNSYPYYCRSSAAQFWKRINHLSVREEQGKQIIQGICNIPVEVVVDPTYLLTKEEWNSYIPQENIINEKYILCYFLGNNENHKKIAREYANERGLKLVSILSTESVSDIDLTYADLIVTGKGPDSFINLIRNAEYVMTDSFHGVAFSVINNRQFYVFYRTKQGSKGSRNSRIDNILGTWHLESRLVLDSYSIDEIDKSDINYEEVNMLISEKRAQSLKFLEMALENN